MSQNDKSTDCDKILGLQFIYHFRSNSSNGKGLRLVYMCVKSRKVISPVK